MLFLLDLLTAGQQYQRWMFVGPGLSEIPFVWVLKLAKYRSAFIFYIFKTPPMWGIIFLVLSCLATACFNFHLKHYSIPLAHENVELRWVRNRWASLAWSSIVRWSAVGGIRVYTWVNPSLCRCWWQRTSTASLGACGWWTNGDQQSSIDSPRCDNWRWS